MDRCIRASRRAEADGYSYGDELGKPLNAQPARAHDLFCGGVKFLLGVRTHRRAAHFPDRRRDGFHRWRNRPPLRFHHEFRQINGSAGRQDHDGGGVHLARATQGHSGLGCDDGCGARFFDYRFALDGEREGSGPTSGTARQTEDLVADHHRDFFSRSFFGKRIALRR